MKKIFFTLILTLCWSFLSAQEKDLEKLIRELDKKEAEAVLVKDTVLLKSIWSKDMTVNSPLNQIVKPGKTTVDRPVITNLGYSTFQRNTEYVMIKGCVVITMGNELVVVKGVEGSSGRTIKRRYTNIWINEDNAWRIIARHANEIQ